MEPQLSSLHSSVKSVVVSVRDAIIETLGSTLVGLYVAGSLVSGAFDPTVSDIDFVAVLAADPTDDMATTLEAMHRRLDRQNPAWADRIDVVYVSAARLRAHHQGIPRMAVISPGAPFHVTSGGADWVLTWFPLREEAVTLVGPRIRDVVPAIEHRDFIEMVREHLLKMPEWIKHDTGRGASAYAILTACRGLYTITLGVRPSKREAATWAMEEFPEWANLIELALTWRNEQWTSPGTDQDSVAATREFVKEMASRIR